MDRSLRFSLYPGSIGRTEPGAKAIMVGEMKKFHVEGGLALLPPDNHMFHIVVENFLGAAAQVVKGMHVAVHEGLESAPLHELHVQGPGEPEDHDEGID